MLFARITLLPCASFYFPFKVRVLLPAKAQEKIWWYIINSAKRLNNVYRCFSSEAELKVTDHKNIGFNYIFFTEHTAKIEGTLLPCFYYSCIRGDPLFQTEVQHKVHTEVHLLVSYQDVQIDRKFYLHLPVVFVFVFFKETAQKKRKTAKVSKCKTQINNLFFRGQVMSSPKSKKMTI